MRRQLLRILVAAALGITAALLVSCGSSGTGLIPSANAGPLQRDFEAVDQAATNGNGNCTETESAIARTEQDFNALPVNIDGGLRRRLREGITALAAHSRTLCAQPLGGVTTGTTQKTTTTPATTETTPSVTTNTNTDTTTTPPPTTTTTPGTGGGTPAPGESESESGGAGGVGAGGGEGK